MTITPNLQMMLSNTTSIDAIMQLINNNTQKVTSRIEDEVEKLYASMTKQSEDMLSMQKVIIKNIEEGITRLEDKVTDLEQEIEELNADGSMDLSRNTLYSDKYERLNSIEINGIPIIDDDDNLQTIVCDILKQIGVEVEEEDLEVCYRLKEAANVHGHVPTICRFSRRKICRTAHRNKRNLRDVNIENVNSKDLYINDYLCWYYKKLAAKCRRLKKNGDITDTWTFKGIVKIRLLDGNVRSVKHQIDLDKVFPNYTYF